MSPLPIAAAGEIAVSNGDGTWRAMPADLVNAKAPPYEAAGGGTTNDTAALTAALADANTSGSQLWFPAGTYKVTSNLPYLHTVTKRGPGILDSNGGIFYVEPSFDQRNNLYVSSSGSDAKDGLSNTTTSRLKTLQGAFDVLRAYGPVLRGTWQINLAAGNYDPATWILDSTAAVPVVPPGTRGRVLVQGPDASAADPTVIFDGTSAALPNAVHVDGPFYIWFRNIMFENWAAEATRMERGVDVTFWHCVADTCDVGFYGNVDTQVTLVGRTIARSCNRGIKVKDQSVLSSRVASSQTPSATGNAVGVDLMESAVAHLTALTVQDSTQRGMEVGRNARCVCDAGCSFKRNATAVLVYASGIFEDDGVAWNDGTADKNTIRYRYRDFSTAYYPGGTYNYMALGERIKSLTADRVSLTSTTAETGLYDSGSASIPAKVEPNDLNHRGRKLRIKLAGTLTGAAGSKTVRVKLGGSTFATFAFADSETGDWAAEVELYHSGATNSGSQRVLTRRFRHDQVVKLGDATTSISMDVSNPMAIAVTGELGSSADTLTLDVVEVAEV